MLKKNSLRPEETDTLIGEESVLEGNIRSKASLRIEGKVHGDIHCDGDVTVGKSGILKSNIRARNVVTAGTIDGSIDSDSLIIHSSGNVQGSINVRSLSISEGGIFQGTSKMDSSQGKAGHAQDQHTNVRRLDKKKKDDSKGAEESSTEKKAAQS